MLQNFLNDYSQRLDRKILCFDLSSCSNENKRSSLVVELFNIFKKNFPEGIILSDDPTLQALDKKINPLRAAKALLGTTIPALFLDIRQGFPLDYFMSTSNAIEKRGFLFLLGTPPLGEEESCRFHTSPIASPNFENYLHQGLKRYAYHFINHQKGEWVLFREAKYQQGAQSHCSQESKRKEKKIEGVKIEQLNTEQRAIFQDFITQERGVFTLFSPRGTGKSWLGAALIKENPAEYILTAPNQFAISQYKGIKELSFRAPDAIFLEEIDQPSPETLIIEEAAKMPLSHLERLSARFQKVLMISSVENYEGTGQGLREKVYDLIPIKKEYLLSKKERFSAEDPLYLLGEYLMLKKRTPEENQFKGEPLLSSLSSSKNRFEILKIRLYKEEELSQFRHERSVREFYHLMNETHYQTNAQDIRRLWDAPDQLFLTAHKKERLIGGIWGIYEGGQKESLSLEVFRGLRRPKGNLVPQMLASQSYYPEAMTLRSLRISRISVIKEGRRLGIGRHLVEQLIEGIKDQNLQSGKSEESKIDYLSVSFGLTSELLEFWRACKMEWIHIGSHQDKTTGLHAAVVVFPLTEAGRKWVKEARAKFKGDADILKSADYLRESSRKELARISHKTGFDERDRGVLEAFREYKRSKHSVYCAKKREEMMNC